MSLSPEVRSQDTSLQEFSCGGKASKLLQLRAAGFPVPEFVVSPDDLDSAALALGFPLAVRSSVLGEDSVDLSYAGLFPSFLNLQSVAEVRAAVAACRNSLASAAVQGYRRRHAQPAEALTVDVILQKMIQPELAGVAFSLDPLTGSNRIRIEACLGTAEKLLAGQLDPLPQDHPLLARHRPVIEQLAERVQQHFGAPQDIEFAIEHETIHLLQARPITRLNFDPQIGEWTTAMFRDGGVAEGVCSPLMWSLYQPVWEDTLKETLQEIRLLKGDFPAARLFFGRPYWNLGAVKQCLLRLPGFSENDFETDLNIIFPPSRSPRCSPKSLWKIVRTLPALLAIDRRLNLQPKEAVETLRTGEQRLQAIAKSTAGDALQTFRRLVELEHRQVETTYFRTIFAAVLARMEFQLRFPHANYPLLLTGLPEPTYVAQLREFQRTDKSSAADWRRALQSIAHHCPLGIDIKLPRFDEQPELLREFAREPAAQPSENRVPADDARSRAEALARLRPWNKRAFSSKLERLRQLVWLREELRDLSNRVYYWIRQLALKIGAERGLGEDIFLMSYAEILRDDRSRVSRNRQEFLAFRNYPAPPEIRPAASPGSSPSSPSLRGLGVSPGAITGRAYVATSLREASRMKPGSILICRFIEPSWVPVLDLSIGIVAESGGVLSHAAVIAREYGIPAVLGVAGATRNIQTGDHLRVDGNQGFVEKLA
jgi:phosphohistidine swiveling domain-containing protein